MQSPCRFCAKFERPNGSLGICDTVLLESENFVVIPTIGSIIPGWLMVLPKKHFLRVESLDKALLEEFSEVRYWAKDALRQSFGPVVCFEHGPTRVKDALGCGVDHAHLHVVSTELDLLTVAKRASGVSLRWRKTRSLDEQCLTDFSDVPYLYFEDQNDNTWVCEAETAGSQFFRRALAFSEGMPQKYDWKSFEFENNVRFTIDEIKRAHVLVKKVE
jgi:diadenosine tetraphosphate (Ap4A) HIT family hydrolase